MQYLPGLLRADGLSGLHCTLDSFLSNTSFVCICKAWLVCMAGWLMQAIMLQLVEAQARRYQAEQRCCAAGCNQGQSQSTNSKT